MFTFEPAVDDFINYYCIEMIVFSYLIKWRNKPRYQPYPDH